MSTEQLDKIKTIKKRIHEDKEWGLVISRVPKQTKQLFITLADTEFCSDYGMTLKWLVDNFKLNPTIELMQVMLLDIQNRLTSLESKGEIPKEIKTLSGKIKKIKE